MTLANQDIELIKREVAGIRDFYQSRLDAELPPLQEEVGRISAQLGRGNSGATANAAPSWPNTAATTAPG